MIRSIPGAPSLTQICLPSKLVSLHHILHHHSTDLLTERKCSRVPESQGVSEPVYEAWTLYMSDTQDSVEKTSICGLNITRRFPQNQPFVSCTNQPFDQDQLVSMTMGAVQRHVVANKRSLPSRLIRARPKTYEQRLDERIQKLPRAVQSELNALLGDREDASSNRWHRRDWTVVVMQEEYHFRFAKAECEQVTKSGRFWNKKKEAKRPKQYFVIIRGGEGKVATDDKGIHRARRNGNPWKRVDEIERIQKQRARDTRRFGKAYHNGLEDRWTTLSDRSASPPPPCRVRVECEGLEDYPPPPSNPFAPSPHYGGCGAHPPPQPPVPFTYPAPPSETFHCPTIPGPYYRPAPPVSMYGVPYTHVGMPYPPPPPPPPPRMPMSMSRPGYDLAGYNVEHYPPRPMSSPPAPRAVSPSPPNTYQVHMPTHSLSPLHPSFMNFAGPPLHSFQVIPEQTGSSRASPPPAPRLSNLTTPTTFSPATSNHTGSSIDRTEVSTPADVQIPDVLGDVFPSWDAREGSVFSI